MAWVFSLILHNMERRIRKLIRVSAITVGALLFTGFVVVAFVINYVFTPDKLTPIVLNVVWGIERSGFFNGREKWAKGFENQRV